MPDAGDIEPPPTPSTPPLLPLSLLLLSLSSPLLPSPYHPVVWESLSDCFRKNGDDALADVAAIIAREAGANLDDVEVAFDDDADDYDFDTEEICELREDVELFDADDDIAPPWHDRWA